jgi:ATP-dependent DNA helicase RecQ
LWGGADAQAGEGVKPASEWDQESAIRLVADAQLPSGPVLLVASTVRTRWAATMAAALLREHGAPQVLLLAMHLQP